jgi:hypothetical protein
LYDQKKRCTANFDDEESEMNYQKVFVLLLAGFFAHAGLGQDKPAQPAASPSPQTKPAPTIAATIDQEIGILEREFVSTAEAMPEDKYNFAPSSLNIPGSDYKGVRTFGQQVKHVATVNFMLWAPLVGEKPPMDINKGEGPESMKSKAEIVKYLKDSYAMGHRAAQSLTAENVVALIPSPFGPGQIPRLFCATFSVAHGFDHYGQLVEYLRMNGIIPPATRSGN